MIEGGAMKKHQKGKRPAKKAVAAQSGLARALKKLSASDIKLTADEKARFERLRLVEQQAQKINYELGGPISQLF